METFEKPLILVLEDDADIRDFFRLMLTTKGFRVATSETFQQAKKILSDNPDVALIILDMLLSGENGIEIAEQLKKDVSTAHIPILMISAHPQLANLVANAPIDSYLEKPFNISDLMNNVNMLLERPI